MPSKKKTRGGRSRVPSAAVRKKSPVRRVATAKAKTKSRSKSPGVRRSAHASRTHAGVWRSDLLDRVARYGVLRSLLALSGFLLFVFATHPGVVPVYSGWAFVPSVLVPVLAPLILMLLLLDALMGRILMSDLQGAARAHRRYAVMINLLLGAGLIMRWLPYYLALGR